MNDATRETEPQPVAVLTLAALAAAKHLPETHLRARGCKSASYAGRRCVAVEYRNEAGEITGVRYRVALAGDRFRWRRGEHAQPYGQDRLPVARAVGWVLLVEGESDEWTCSYHDLPALGIPGKSTWRSECRDYLAGIPDVLLWQEPGAEDFTERVFRDVPHLRVIRAEDAGYKDVSDAHCGGEDVPALLARLRASARPAAELLAEREERRVRDLRRVAAPVFDAPAPLALVDEEIERAGYAGDRRPALLVYLAATARVLAVRPGAMLPHLLLLGSASSGKSWTLHMTRRLLPAEALVSIDAGSPRALIYGADDLAHKALFFGEADSLPAGEDNPAASAIRNLLAENALAYDVTEKDAATGSYVVRRVRKPGPTVLLTTSTRALGWQLMTRLLSAEVPETPQQVRVALAAQAARELAPAADDAPPEPLLAAQSYLQSCAPWQVVVPFAGELADALAKTTNAVRVLRDFNKLISLVKACTVLRHRHRRRDAGGRLLAQLADYETVRELASEVYAATADGVSDAVRATVEAVARRAAAKQADDAEPTVTLTEAATELALHKGTVSRHCRAACAAGYLVNTETRRGYPARLRAGEPLPPRDGGLPRLTGCTAAECCTTPGQQYNTPGTASDVASGGGGCTVAPLTGRIRGAL